MNSQIDARDLRFFLSVATELHFRRAAERLGIAQPHLSLHIRQLEERLGVKLLDRTTRAVRLTKAGEHFLEKAKFALAQIDDAFASTRLLSEGKGGRLRVGFTPAAAFGILPRILREFKRRSPDVDLSLAYKDTALQTRDLLEGRLDLGFLRLPIHTRRLSTLALAREGVVAAIPRKHPLAASTPFLLEDLADHGFVQYTAVLGVDFQEHINSYCNRAGFRPRVLFEASDTYSILTLVAAGFGIAILPEWVRRLSLPNVVFRPLHEIPPLVELALAWVPQNQSPSMLMFKEVVDGCLKGDSSR